MIRNIKLEKSTEEPLEKVVQHFEEEARMILPGIQALFGFQLIAVFNERFYSLSSPLKYTHLIALLCSALSILFVLMPAAYHRQAEPTRVSGYFASFSSVVLTIALAPLLIALCLDLFVITEVVTESDLISLLIAIVFFILFATAWFIFPFIKRRSNI